MRTRSGWHKSVMANELSVWPMIAAYQMVKFPADQTSIALMMLKGPLQLTAVSQLFLK